jgi:hypothetical protein
MEELFNELQRCIADKFGSNISLIDEDFGQLDALINGEDMYPVTFPCVLIGTPKTKWKTLSTTMQQGELTLSIRLAFDCYDDTHYGSTQEGKATERMQIASRLNGCIHGWKLQGRTQSLFRTESREYSLPGGIKVYEQIYTTMVVEEVKKD